MDSTCTEGDPQNIEQIENVHLCSNLVLFLRQVCFCFDADVYADGVVHFWTLAQSYGVQEGEDFLIRSMGGSIGLKQIYSGIIPEQVSKSFSRNLQYNSYRLHI